ncbi:MAG: Rid family detoxifying hydrolase [Bacteroidota bacterium]|nr:Rid family detoxifying hydrolase [Bacteroidota bacterium]MDP4260336.1 Rid family detoxifying hydrolase [Bacteroidota bacterium]
MKTIEAIQSAELAVSPGPFSTGVKANGFLFLSGQVGIDRNGKLADDFDLEVRQIFTNIGAVLLEQKLTFDHIVSVTVYLKDMQHFKRLNELYKTYFNGYYPSRTCIAVLELPLMANVELTITASTNN